MKRNKKKATAWQPFKFLLVQLKSKLTFYYLQVVEINFNSIEGQCKYKHWFYNKQTFYT